MGSRGSGAPVGNHDLALPNAAFRQGCPATTGSFRHDNPTAGNHGGHVYLYSLSPPECPPMHMCSVGRSHWLSWDCMDCGLPGFSVHGILQARILEWVAISSSRGSSRARDGTRVSCLGKEDSLPRRSHLGSPHSSVITYTTLWWTKWMWFFILDWSLLRLGLPW